MDHTDFQLENVRGAIKLGGDAVKALLLVNGGGAAGLLTFYGNLVAKGGETPSFDKHALLLSMGAFGAGLISAIFCSGFAYLSQLITATRPESRAEVPLRMVAIILALVSSISFTGGVVSGVASLP